MIPPGRPIQGAWLKPTRLRLSTIKFNKTSAKPLGTLNRNSQPRTSSKTVKWKGRQRKASPSHYKLARTDPEGASQIRSIVSYNNLVWDDSTRQTYTGAWLKPTRLRLSTIKFNKTSAKLLGTLNRNSQPKTFSKCCRIVEKIFKC